MRKTLLNMPAVLVHTVDGVLYRVNGILTNINESNLTCSMKFKGYPILEGIPMSSVYLNEDFVDKVKEYGKKAWNNIKKVVKAMGGMLFPSKNDGTPDLDYMNHPMNIAIRAALNSDGAVTFYPSEKMVALAEKYGVSLPNSEDEELLADANNKEAEEANIRFKRVMNAYVANESMTFLDAIKYVNEHYYDTVDNSLNEAQTLSLHNVVGSSYGEEMTRAELVRNLRTNIKSLLKSQIVGNKIEYSRTKPYLIWGAPGIGKTAVIKELISDLRHKKGYNLNLQYVIGGSLFRDDLVIPDTNKNIAGETISGDVPKTWVPVYRKPLDAATLKQRDDWYNSGLFAYGVDDITNYKEGDNMPDTGFDGGIIFLDEFSRLPALTQNIIMNLINEHSYNGMYMATKWCFVLAANRAYDMLEVPDDAIWEPAKADRYTSVTYVPTKKEWLQWAREINPVTGEQNVDELICAFLLQSDDNVWYDALDIGSRNTQLPPEDLKKVYDNPSNTKISRDRQWWDDANTVLTQSLAGLDMITWTPRTWTEKVSDGIYNVLRDELFEEYPELYGRTEVLLKHAHMLKDEHYDPSVNGDLIEGIFRNCRIDYNRLKTALNKLPEETWLEWWDGYSDKLDPTHEGDRYSNFMAWLSYHIGISTGPENLPKKQWENYSEYKKLFTSDVCANIWKDGQLGIPGIDEEDNILLEKPHQYRTLAATSNCKWKANTLLANEIRDTIMSGFPGGDAAMEQIIKKDYDTLAYTTSDWSAPEVKKLYTKYRNKYTIHWKDASGNDAGKLPLLFTDATLPRDAREQEIAINILWVLEHSEFARMLANAMMYICKFVVLMSSNTCLSDIINEFANVWVPEHIHNSTLAEYVVYRNVEEKGSYESAMANPDIHSSHLIDSPALIMVKNTMNRHYNMIS